MKETSILQEKEAVSFSVENNRNMMIMPAGEAEKGETQRREDAW